MAETERAQTQELTCARTCACKRHLPLEPPSCNSMHAHMFAAFVFCQSWLAHDVEHCAVDGNES
eukprot:9782946-Lingulodinium_polyedra.AAC.2